jgi:hypothetical protein
MNGYSFEPAKEMRQGAARQVDAPDYKGAQAEMTGRSSG